MDMASALGFSADFASYFLPLLSFGARSHDLRALIARCDAAKDGPAHDEIFPIRPAELAALARDALRFQHITRNAEHLPDPAPYPGQPTRYGWSVQWGMWCDQNTSLREAIDQDMENNDE